MKRIIALWLCLCLTLSVSLPATAIADSGTVEKAIIALEIMTGDQNGNMNLSRPVTRAEFAKMLVAASSYKDTVQNGSGSSPFKDVKYTHWASDYIKTVVDAKWMVGYVDGTFRPDNTITLEESASALLKLLGYGTADLTGTYPKAQIAKFKALKLDTGISPVQGQPLSRYECMYIFYNLMGAKNKNGVLYGVTQGHVMNTDDEIDYDELVRVDDEGPFVIRSGSLSDILPFDAGQATVYRNGKVSSPSSVIRYDVVYYNEGTKEVWVYANRVIGTYTAAFPNTVSPSSVTVSGNSYAIGTDEARDLLSVKGPYRFNDTIALLLGMNGDVADVVPAVEINVAYYGVITKIEFATYTVDTSSSQATDILSVACTDGVIRQCAAPIGRYTAGDRVSINYAKGDLSVTILSGSTLSGKVNAKADKLGDYPLSADAEIMDISKEGPWTTLRASRLAGVDLAIGKIYYYVLNAQKEISHLILNDVTGDMYTYGILTGVNEVNTAGKLNGTYQYVINGTAGTYNTTTVLYNMQSGPTIFYYRNNQLDDMKSLTAVSIAELAPLVAKSASQSYAIADNVQVYVPSQSNNYSLTSLSAVNTEEYTITGYYETIYPAGGQIRLMIAVKK